MRTYYRLHVAEIINPKKQIPNDKKVSITETQNSKPVLIIGDWCLAMVCNLVLEICEL
jgi:hypothetical protein